MNAIEYTRENCKAIDACLIASGNRPIFAEFKREEFKEINEEEMFG